MKEFQPLARHRNWGYGYCVDNQSTESLIPALDQTSVHSDPQNVLPAFYNNEKEYLFYVPIYTISSALKDRYEIADAKLLYYNVPVQQFAEENRVINVRDAR